MQGYQHLLQHLLQHLPFPSQLCWKPPRPMVSPTPALQTSRQLWPVSLASVSLLSPSPLSLSQPFRQQTLHNESVLLLLLTACTLPSLRLSVNPLSLQLCTGCHVSFCASAMYVTVLLLSNVTQRFTVQRGVQDLAQSNAQGNIPSVGSESPAHQHVHTCS